MTVSRIAIYVSCVVASLSGIAMAATDPVIAAQGATDAGVNLLYQYGPLWGGMAIVFGLFSSILAKNESQHWIAQGRTLAAIVAALGVFGAALTAHFTGAPWSGVAVTAVMAIFKLMQPTVAAPAAPAKFGAVVMLFGLSLGIATQVSCGVPTAADHAIVDCTKADKAALEAAGLRLLAAPSWSLLETEAIEYGETIGGCALLAVIDSYRPPTTAAPVASSSVAGTHALVERVRAHFGGVTWQTAQGAR
jgi:hypothetical protein